MMFNRLLTDRAKGTLHGDFAADKRDLSVWKARAVTFLWSLPLVLIVQGGRMAARTQHTPQTQQQQDVAQLVPGNTPQERTHWVEHHFNLRRYAYGDDAVDNAIHECGIHGKEATNTQVFCVLKRLPLSHNYEYGQD